MYSTPEPNPACSSSAARHRGTAWCARPEDGPHQKLLRQRGDPAPDRGHL